MLDAFKKLEVIAKGFANVQSPFTTVTVRTHVRKFESKKKGTRVKQFRRKRFQNSSQMRGITNVQDV